MKITGEHQSVRRWRAGDLMLIPVLHEQLWSTEQFRDWGKAAELLGSRAGVEARAAEPMLLSKLACL